MSSSVEDHDESAAESHPPRDPDEILAERLFTTLSLFALRQREVLRIVRFMDERSHEMDNATRHAKELITAQLDEPHDTAPVERLVSLMSERFDRASTPDDDSELSEEERDEAFYQAIEEVGRQIPKGLEETYFDSAIRAVYSPPAGGLLRSSLLVSLVGELEMSVNHLARAAVERRPGTLEESGRTFSWAEISSYATLDEFRDVVVSRAIDDVLRGSLSDWMNYFKKKFAITPGPIADRYEAQEIVQRRHCIVHNSGIASSLYVDKLSSFKVDAKVGDSLEVDSEYLQRAADELYLIAFSLVWSTTVQLLEDKEWRGVVLDQICNRTYYLLQDHRYSLLIRLKSLAPIDKLPEAHGLIIRVNCWLAYKMSGRFEEVRAEIEGFDTSSKSRDFQLAKWALLDDFERAGKIADSMRRDGDLNEQHYYTWPLLSGLRRHRRDQKDAASEEIVGEDAATAEQTVDDHADAAAPSSSRPEDQDAAPSGLPTPD